MESKTISIINFSIVFALLFTTLAIAVTPTPIPNAKDALKECGSKLTTACGNSIFHYIFGAGKTVTHDCCGELMKMGRQCHALITYVSIKNKGFTVEQIEAILTKNNKVWEVCFKNGQIS